VGPGSTRGAGPTALTHSSHISLYIELFQQLIHGTALVRTIAASFHVTGSVHIINGAESASDAYIGHPEPHV
jgi:hypothetical protein